MLKKYLIIILFLLSQPFQANAADWVILLNTNDYKLYLDNSSVKIEEVGETRLFVWLKFDYSKPIKVLNDLSLFKTHYTVYSAKMRYCFECENNKYAIEHKVFCDKDGKIMKEEDKSYYSTDLVIPDTLEEFLFNKFCANSKPVVYHQFNPYKY